MTTEQDAEIGRMYREKRKAEARRDTLEKKLDSFKEQVRAVYNDWDRLEVVNGESLVVPSGPSPEFRPLPPEDEIARTIVELRDRRQTIENLEAALR